MAPAPEASPREVSFDGGVLAAIDVGTNAVRLEIARPLADGAIEILHQERDPVRPGEGVFKTGGIPPETAERLMSTLRRYSALCKRYSATVRAVATSALREARNRDEIVKRALVEAGLELEVVSGREEARLICLGVLHGKPAKARSIVVDIGGGSTEIANAVGERPEELWSVAIGAVRLTEIFDASGKVGAKKLELMRRFADEAFREAMPRLPRRYPRTALGSSGTINTVVAYAAAEGTAHATAQQITKAVDKLSELGLSDRRRLFDSKRAEIIVAGAVVLETAVKHLRLASISAVDRGLRDGLLLDVLHRGQPNPSDTSLPDAAMAMGRRFGSDENHSRQVARIALSLFDSLASLHRLPSTARALLEVAAILHDIGHAVSYQKHHKHTAYLIQNADLPGINVRERDLIALVARYHRRSPPERTHPGLVGVSATEFVLIRKLSTILRMADSFDRSHQQAIRSIKATVRGAAVVLRLAVRAPIDLELWDAEREAGLFRQVFGKRVEFVTARG